MDGLELRVADLDALDGTPVLDIKTYMREFEPVDPVSQPAWSRELRRDYYHAAGLLPRRAVAEPAARWEAGQTRSKGTTGGRPLAPRV
jgi:hypothetical protein